MQRGYGSLLACLLFLSCNSSIASKQAVETGPEWKSFRSTAANDGSFQGTPEYQPNQSKFVFGDLKNESDSSLASRLLGAVGTRIAHIDRHRDRWRYYRGDFDPIENITLFSRPETGGSAFGICRTERYEIAFSDSGAIESVKVSPYYGIEGPIFQKKDFDWDSYEKVCQGVPSNHTPSYFPAGDSLEAQDLAVLLSTAIFQAGQPGQLPFELKCESLRKGKCSGDIRQFLSELRFDAINETSHANCLYSDNSGDECFTIKVGENRLGNFPKVITIKGSTYLHENKVYSVSVIEGFTIS